MKANTLKFFKGRPKARPTAPLPRVVTKTPAGVKSSKAKPDGRTLRYAGQDPRPKQFNTRVSEEFAEGLKAARRGYEQRTGLDLHLNQFLEVLLAHYKKSRGAAVPLFGLSDKALAVANAISKHIGEANLMKVVEDALATRAAELGIAEVRKRR